MTLQPFLPPPYTPPSPVYTQGIFQGPDPWFDVKNPTYGAVGDGVHDDTAAIMAADAAAAAAGGAIVFFPPGTYKATANLLPSSKNTWEGVRGASVIAIADDGSAAGLNVYLNNVSDVTIRYLTLSPTGIVGRTGNYGAIRIGQGCARINIVENRITASSSTGIHLLNCTDVLLFGNRISGTYADGVHISRQSTRIRVIGNDIFDTGDDGIAIVSFTDAPAAWAACSDIVIANNTVFNLSQVRAGHGQSSGITCIGGQYISIIGNTVDSTLLHGIGVDSGPAGALSGSTTRYPLQVSIVGNTVRNWGETVAGGVGINVSKARQVVVSANVVDNGGAQSSVGIALQNATKEVTIIGNTVSRTVNRGIVALQTVQNDARLIQELFTNMGDAGLASVGISETIIKGNHIHKVGGIAIHCTGIGAPTQAGLLVEGNDVELLAGGASDGVNIDTCNQVAVTGNRFRTFGAASTGFCVRVSVVTDGLVANNVGEGGTDVGAGILGSTTVRVHNNIFNGMTSFGVWDSGTNAGLSIESNTVLNNGTSVAINSATTIGRNNRGFNPLGVLAVGVGATTVAMGPLNTDAMVYVTANAAGTTQVAVGATNIATVAASDTFGFFVPAGTTWTYTYANAPTHVVLGE